MTAHIRVGMHSTGYRVMDGSTEAAAIVNREGNWWLADVDVTNVLHHPALAHAALALARGHDLPTGWAIHTSKRGRRFLTAAA